MINIYDGLMTDIHILGMGFAVCPAFSRLSRQQIGWGTGVLYPHVFLPFCSIRSWVRISRIFSKVKDYPCPLWESIGRVLYVLVIVYAISCDDVFSCVSTKMQQSTGYSRDLMSIFSYPSSQKKWSPRTRMLTRMMRDPGIKVMREEKGSVKGGVWSVECGVWNVKCGVWNVKYV